MIVKFFYVYFYITGFLRYSIFASHGMPSEYKVGISLFKYPKSPHAILHFTPSYLLLTVPRQCFCCGLF